MRSRVQLTLALTLALTTCTSSQPVATPPPPLAPQDAGWSEFIHSHTAGSVSSGSPIRMLFVGDVVPAERVGTEDAGRLRFDPALAGAAVWKSARELLFVPSAPLPSGQRFRAHLSARGLSSLPARLQDYAFDFSTRAQEFEVRIDGIAPEAEGQSVTGSVITADVARSDAVEKLLAAKWEGRNQAIQWSHSSDGLTHPFAVHGLSRRERAGALLLSWDARALGLEGSGERRVEIPSLGEFKVLRVVSLETPPSVRVDFSQPLDPAQDLSGLAHLESGTSRLQVDGAELRLFPDQTESGARTLTLEPGIRSSAGSALGERSTHDVRFPVLKPGVRFAGKGTILPASDGLKIPFEAVNVAAVQVTAFEIFEDNLGQFLQVNALSGQAELRRVGRHLWRRTLQLDGAPRDQWNRYAIDAAPLFAKHPGSLLRLTLSIRRKDSTYSCSGQNATGEPAAEPAEEAPLPDSDQLEEAEASGWDYIEEYYEGTEYGQAWQHREDPCWDAYYAFSRTARDARNFLASNLGLLAKAPERGTLEVVATDLRTSEPLAGVELEAFNPQQRSLARGVTDAQGFAQLRTNAAALYLTGRLGQERGVLKLGSGSALPVSHFDVGGERVERGIKGTLYGERGVWRPGDEIHLTLAIDDRANPLPAGHPATLRLFNPRGQLVESVSNTQPVGDFYAFTLRTAEDAPTGPWKAVAQLGGLRFEKRLRIEALVPNRLKVELGFPREELRASQKLEGRVSSRWLHGASAAGLLTDVALELAPRPTQFGRFEGFRFDDPARSFESKQQEIFSGKLDAKGEASFSSAAPQAEGASGVLAATFTTRVHEEGGGFSFAQREVRFHPYDAYVGIKLPKGDAARNMLLTDQVHTVQIASVDPAGEPVSLPRIEVSVYQIGWKWWWDHSAESLAQYTGGSYANALRTELVATANGQGHFDFEIRAPAWGRYLIRACDQAGGHCTGQIFYIDWPGWAGTAGEERAGGANALALESDKPAYRVGETARLRIPKFERGRALLSVETGSALVERRWIEPGASDAPLDVKITPAMVPNAYLAVSLLQPHTAKGNDRPLRLYGYVPIEVSDPATHLKPVIASAAEWAPRKPMKLEVSEASGRPMTYTLAIVDEGLLGLTSFETPDLHRAFFQREALGVRTWDLFDDVTGGYGAALERLLSLGGDGFARATRPQERARRFPPVVVFRGPFQLEAGKTDRHDIELPQYIGAVRAMVVAGSPGAYGSTEVSVPVREPLMVLPTLPRVLRPGEELQVPVSVFATEAKLGSVAVALEPEAARFGSSGKPAQLAFAEPGDQLAFLPLKVGERPGMGKLHFVAKGGGREAVQDVNIEVRAPNPRTVRVERREIAPGQSWELRLEPYGLAGTQRAALELSTLPALNLESRLEYLIHYPHGCLEQTTSAAFPQLFLPDLAKLQPDELERVRSHVQAAIQRLRAFQLPGGGYTYWPDTGHPSDWAEIYANHFLIEASQRGYSVPADMLADGLRHLQTSANAWVAGASDASFVQAYRLYALALASRAEIAAMNRLREAGPLAQPAAMLLASAYHSAGLDDVAQKVAPPAGIRLASFDANAQYRTFGSDLRDRALMLEPLAALGRAEEARALAGEIARELASELPYSTQSTAWALLALARYYAPLGTPFEFEWKRAKGDAQRVTASAALTRLELGAVAADGEALLVRNLSQRPVTAQVAIEAVPRAGEEQAAANGLALSVRYLDRSGAPLEVGELPLGKDLAAEIEIRNATQRAREHLALTYTAASGLQIQETPAAEDPEQSAKRPLTPNFYWMRQTEQKESAFEYRDVRDDAVHTYFELKPGAVVRFQIRLNASYAGRYYLPAVRVEDMYDPAVQAVAVGRWVTVRDTPESAPSDAGGGTTAQVDTK